MSRIIRPWSNRIRPSSPGGRRGGGGAVTLTKSVDFDGLTQYARKSGIGLSGYPSGAFTLSMFMRFPGGNPGALSQVITASGNSNQDLWTLRKNSGTGSMQLQVRDNGSLVVNSGAFVSGTISDWTLWSITRTAVGAWSFWEGTTENAAGTYATALDIDTLTLAAFHDDSAPAPIRVARMALWESDKSGDFASWISDPQADWSDSAHLWKMGDGDTLPTLTDSGSVGGWDLTAVNSPTIETDYPVAP